MDARRLVGWNLRRLRVEHEMSIEALAGEAEVEPAYLGKVERGEVNSSLDVLAKLAGALRGPSRAFPTIPAWSEATSTATQRTAAPATRMRQSFLGIVGPVRQGRADSSHHEDPGNRAKRRSHAAVDEIGIPEGDRRAILCRRLRRRKPMRLRSGDRAHGGETGSLFETWR